MTDISKTRNSTQIIVLSVLLLIIQQSWAKPLQHEFGLGSNFEYNDLNVPDEIEEETNPLISLYAILSYSDIFFGPEVDNSRYFDPLLAELVASEKRKNLINKSDNEKNVTEADDDDDDHEDEEDDDELIEFEVNEEPSEVSQKPVTISETNIEESLNPNPRVTRVKRSPEPQFQQKNNNWGLGGKFGEYRSSEFNKGSAFQNPGFSGLYDQFGNPNKFGKK